jgi:P-type Ca2+ transporter type 2C
MLLLLLAVGAIYFALGALGEALMPIVFAYVSIVITIVQEARTERVMESLGDLTRIKIEHRHLTRRHI